MWGEHLKEESDNEHMTNYFSPYGSALDCSAGVCEEAAASAVSTDSQLHKSQKESSIQPSNQEKMSQCCFPFPLCKYGGFHWQDNYVLLYVCLHDFYM